MSATVQADHIPERIVTNRGVATLFVLLSAWSLYQRIRHVSARFRVPEDHGAAFTLDLLISVGCMVVMVGLFGSTRDRVERTGIVVCFASAIFRPLQMLFPAYATAIWWVNLGFLLAFFLASVAVLQRLNGPDRASDDLIDPPPTT